MLFNLVFPLTPLPEWIRQSVSVPAAEDYLLMLQKSLNAPNGTPQFNVGCRSLSKVQYGSEMGMAEIPLAVREMTVLTSLGPEWATANPRCIAKKHARHGPTGVSDLQCRHIGSFIWHCTRCSVGSSQESS